MTSNWLKYLLGEIPLAPIDIAKELNITRQVVGAVVRGEERSNNVEQYIANALGMTHADIWPLEKPAAKAA